MINIACVGDIHAPIYFDLFKKSIEKIENVDLFLLAGDIIYRGRFREMDHVVDEIRKKFKKEIIGCFGNEEYEGVRDELRKREVTWLEDEAKILEFNKIKIGIVGTTGSLDAPTKWQSKNILNIREIYEERIKKIDEILSKLNADFSIVLSHYAPSYKTIVGENKFRWKWLGCKKFEEVILRRKPNFWIHAHAHNAMVTEIKINTTTLLNVSLPAIKEIKIVRIDEGLRKFW